MLSDEEKKYDKNYQFKIEAGRQQGKSFRAGMEFSNKIWEDKIKTIIEEIHNEPMNYNPDEYWIENECKGYAIDRLQSLLEEE